MSSSSSSPDVPPPKTPSTSPDVPPPNTLFTTDADEDDFFLHGSLRHSSLRAVSSSTHAPPATVAQSAILEHGKGVERRPESDLADPPTQHDPFVTPTPSAPGSTHNLAQLAGATASRLSMYSPVYNFAGLANGHGTSPAPHAGAVAHKRGSSNAIAEVTILPRVSTAPGTLAGPGSSVPPVPPLPHFQSRNSRSMVGVADLAASTGAGVQQPGKRESFAAPPPMVRPLSAHSASHARRMSQRPGTSGTVGTIVSFSTVPGTPSRLSPPGSSHSLSEKAAASGLIFQTDALGRKVPTGLLSKRMQSSMLGPDEVPEKPWLANPSPRARMAWWITFFVALFGVVASFLRIYYGAKTVQLVKGNLCLVLDDEFDGSSIDKSVWGWEVQMDGFGNGEFEMTTNSPNNSFVEDGVLYIVPTLTSDVIGSSAVFDGHTFNVTGCTSLNASACGAVSNITTRTVINPVQSARLTTLNSTSIQYGRVEIRAKNPRGDWLWPALWMLPVNNTYGPWPLSGEIDIMEARGNAKSYPAQGRDYVRASLNWGPITWLNEVSKTFGWWNSRRRSFDQDFHVYALEWTDKFIRAYVDSRLRLTLDISFDEPFFKRGDFPLTVLNGSQAITVPNPWGNDNFAAPFNQPFYLIMDVAVGGTNGWFPDNEGDKPWLDQSLTAMYDFARSQDVWYETWPTDVRDRALAVDYVKMWQLC